MFVLETLWAFPFTQNLKFYWLIKEGLIWNFIGLSLSLYIDSCSLDQSDLRTPEMLGRLFTNMEAIAERISFVNKQILNRKEIRISQKINKIKEYVKFRRFCIDLLNWPVCSIDT